MGKRRIVLIGPVYPYKGGISHYTGLMHQALAKENDVMMISYKLQYPKLLFKKEQKDYSNDAFKVEETQYWIHTANPVNWFRIANKINQLHPELVIIQWWHPYFAPCYKVLTQFLKDKKILFVCHNVFPHERFPLDRCLTKAVLKQGDYFIVQSGTDSEDLKTIVKNPVYRQTVHPTYNAFQFENMTKEEARRKIGLQKNEKVLLFFGFVREYKGLKFLIQAMPEIIRQLENIKLLIVGDFGKEEEKQKYLEMIGQNNIVQNVSIFDGYIPDKEVEKYFAACDLVVCPYISATQSGIVQIAFGFEKPVIVTDVGGLPDVVQNGKTGYVVEAGKPYYLSNAVTKYFKEGKEKEFAENVKKEAYRFSWDRMTEIINEMIS